jgi:hypothetical protein
MRARLVFFVLLALGAPATLRGQPAPASPPAAPTAEGAFEGQGQAHIVGGNRAAARERALDEALRAAVLRAVDAHLGADTRAQRSSEIGVLLTGARRLVDRYRVLGESEADGLYRVHVEATVPLHRVQQFLGRKGADAEGTGVSPAAAARPTVAVRASSADVAASLRTALAEEGAAPVAGPPFRAQLTVTSRVTEEGEVRGAGVVSVRVELDARLAQQGMDTAFSASARRFAPDAASARAAALAASARDLSRETVRRLPVAPVPGGVQLTLVGSGRVGYRDARAVATAVGALAGVRAVEPRRFGDREVVLLVRTAMSTDDLAARISAVAIPGLRHRLERQSGSLLLRVAPADAAGGNP